MQHREKRNIYDDAVAYDLIHDGRALDSIEFYKGLVDKCGKRVLELGCGTGRLTIPLALDGYEATGIDIEETMLAHAREKAAEQGANVEFVHGDVRNFDLGKQFDAIMFPANSLSHLLDNESVEACLASVRKHLTDDGCFIFQVFTPSFSVLTRDPNRRYPVAEYDDHQRRGKVIVTESNVYDRATQVNHITWYYKFEDTQEEVAKYVPLRMFFPQELDSLLRHNGFEIVAKYGNFEGTPYMEDPSHQIPVCRKRKDYTNV